MHLFGRFRVLSKADNIYNGAMRVTVFILAALLSLPGDLSAQWAIRVDPHNLAFQNYNLGLDFQKNLNILGLDVSYLSKGWVWQTEFPGAAKSRGLRLNLDYKRTFKKAPAIYAGILVRLEKLHFPDLTHWPGFDYNYTRDDKRLIVAGKLGLRSTSSRGRFYIDFGIGPGLRFLKREQVLISVRQQDPEAGQDELTAQANESLGHERRGFHVQLVPMLHLQTGWRLGPK